MRFTKDEGYPHEGTWNCTHFNHICSIPLVHRPKGESLVILTILFRVMEHLFHFYAILYCSHHTVSWRFIFIVFSLSPAQLETNHRNTAPTAFTVPASRYDVINCYTPKLSRAARGAEHVIGRPADLWWRHGSKATRRDPSNVDYLLRGVWDPISLGEMQA